MTSLSSFLSIFLILVVDGIVDAKTFDNRIAGKPFVSCRPQGISLVAETEDFFEGQVYVKGSKRNSKCVKQYGSETNSTDIELSIEAKDLIECGFNIWKKPNSENVLISGFIVISFHPELVTSSDRAFAAHCEFDKLQSSLQKTDVPFNGIVDTDAQLFGQFEQPRVKMSIFSGGPKTVKLSDLDNLEDEISVARVGEPIIFKWDMIEKNQENDVFGIQLERCIAEGEDGKGSRIIENGCSLDDELISDASTSSDYTKIFANSLAFKFPEQDVLNIKCELRNCIKKSEHLIITGKSIEDLCEKDNQCDDRRSRRDMKYSNVSRTDVIFVSGKLRIDRSKRFEKGVTNKQRDPRLCMSENVYYLGVSSIFLMYFFTISTTIFFKFTKL